MVHFRSGQPTEAEQHQAVLSLLSSFTLLLLPFRIAYPVVQMATQSGKNVYLTVTKESGNSIVLLFKMISTRAASGLYRAITETHAFYRHVPLRVS